MCSQVIAYAKKELSVNVDKVPSGHETSARAQFGSSAALPFASCQGPPWQDLEMYGGRRWKRHKFWEACALLPFSRCEHIALSIDSWSECDQSEVGTSSTCSTSLGKVSLLAFSVGAFIYIAKDVPAQFLTWHRQRDAKKWVARRKAWVLHTLTVLKSSRIVMSRKNYACFTSVSQNMSKQPYI